MSMIVSPYRYAAGGDPFFSSVVALFHFDGSNGSTGPFVNSIAGHSDLNGSGTPGPTLSNTQSKYGGTSLLLSGANAAISASSSADGAFGTGDFTVEFSLYQTAFQLKNILDVYGSTGSDSRGIFYTDSSGNLAWYSNSTTRIISAGGLLTVNAWHDAAVARVSGTTRLFIDGTVVGSFVDSTNITGSGFLIVGAASAQWAGFIDEVRVTKGVGRYSGNYTPAIAPFPNS